MVFSEVVECIVTFGEVAVVTDCDLSLLLFVLIKHVMVLVLV